MTVQKIKVEGDELDRAVKYYSILSILKDLKLTPQQVSLMAFMAVKGSVSSQTVKEEFCEKFGSSLDSINNLKSLLSRKGLLVKAAGIHRVHPKITTDFNKELVLNITLGNKG